MTRVFISYAHEDRIQVAHVVEHLRESGAEVHTDRVDVRPDDFLSSTLRRQVQDSDFVCLMLSENSAASPWVQQEVAEAIAQELRTRHARLLPCMLSSCRIPGQLERLVRHDRAYIDFRQDFAAGLLSLTESISNGGRPIFLDAQHLRLDIPVQGLEIYLTGERWNWQRVEELRYLEMIDGYLLLGFRIEPWSCFRHFAICGEAQTEATRSALRSAGMIVTGTGDREPQLGRRRIWFTLPEFPIDGKRGNNRWPSSE